MDRTEELLQGLTNEQDAITFSNAMMVLCSDDVSKASYQRQRDDAIENRDALRQQIADEWRAKDAALENLLHILEYNAPRSDPNGEYTRKIEHAQAILARAKGSDDD